jgi:hypothetical protein
LRDTSPASARLIYPSSMPTASASLTTLIGGRRRSRKVRNEESESGARGQAKCLDRQQ